MHKLVICEMFCWLTCSAGLQMMGHASGILPEHLASYGSANSYNSVDSGGGGNAGRNVAMSKAFQKAQQQVQSGMLSEAQVGSPNWPIAAP